MIRPDLGRLFGPPQSHLLDDPGDYLPRPIEGAENAPELCQLLDRWTPDKHPDGALGQVKLDGRRALYIGGQLVSREGLPMNQAAHSHRALSDLEGVFGKPMFFDGEYVHPEGLFACGKPGGTIWLFDAVPLDIWRRDGASAPFDQRIAMLLSLGQHCFGPALGALQPFPLNSPEDVIEKAAELIALDYEGITVKKRTGIYRRRRHPDWLKVKHWQTVHCRIVDLAGPRFNDFTAVMVNHKGAVNKVSASSMSRDKRIRLATARGDLDRWEAKVEFAGYTSGGLMREAVLIDLVEGRP